MSVELYGVTLHFDTPQTSLHHAAVLAGVTLHPATRLLSVFPSNLIGLTLHNETENNWLFEPSANPVVLTYLTAQQIQPPPEGASKVIVDWEAADVDGYEVYRLAGDHPLPSGSSRQEVIDASAVLVDDTLDGEATSCEEELTESENGETWTYYVFAHDSDTYSESRTAVVETIPSVPVGTSAKPRVGSVVIYWQFPPDSYVDGINVYRSSGAVFDASQAVKLNSELLTGNRFEDGPLNTENRVSEGTVPYPTGEVSYRIESQRDGTIWDIGTQNESQDQSEILIAERDLS